MSEAQATPTPDETDDASVCCRPAPASYTAATQVAASAGGGRGGDGTGGPIPAHSRGTIISLCDRTGNMVRPWADAGYDCICVDNAHSIRREHRSDNVRLVWGDVRHWWPDSLDDVAAVFAFPPCTHLASSGARDWRQKGLTLLIDALSTVEACRRICAAAGERGAAWAIENPVGRLSTLWGEPDHIFDPYEYAGYLADPVAEAYTKRTCLWTGGGFRMPEPRAVVPVLGSKMHTLPGGPSEAKTLIRNATPAGFAEAVYLANARRVGNPSHRHPAPPMRAAV